MKPVELENGLVQSRWAIRACLLVALLAFGVAVAEWNSPSLPPFHGRIAWLAELLFAVAGPHGQFLVCVAVVIAAVAAARSFWRHAPRVPGDRWL